MRCVIELLSEAQFDALPAAQFLVPGVIQEASLGMIVGAPGSCKTFTALDLALCVAAGAKTWLGRPLLRHGPVVYVLAEGQGRFKYRKAAWKQEHQIAGELPFYIRPCPVNLRDEAMMATFLAQVQAHQPLLIIFDTLNRCLPGSEESNKDFSQAIVAAERLQRATGATVQLLHHPTKAGDTARGGGNLLGAVESELWLEKVTGDNERFTLTTSKEKDAADDLTIHLRRRVVELAGMLEHGEPVTSCVIELASANGTAEPTVSRPSWQRIEQLLKAGGGVPRTIGDIAKALDIEWDTVRKAVNSTRGGQRFVRVHGEDAVDRIGLKR
jgi:hypothetical protein